MLKAKLYCLLKKKKKDLKGNLFNSNKIQPLLQQLLFIECSPYAIFL